MIKTTKNKKGTLGIVYSPIKKIPIGEAIKHADGTHALRVKNPRTKAYDDIPLDKLCEEVVKKADD
ncbi:MAG: hypothetical protein ACOX6G_10900 [Christensenellales bacterium]|jgi:hypothetical protein